MNLLLDMNLSPSWISVLEAQGWTAKHWYSVGPADAPDVHIMRWAKERRYCVVTNDLGFSAILAATRAEGPSVIQIRGQDLSPKKSWAKCLWMCFETMNRRCWPEQS